MEKLRLRKSARKDSERIEKLVYGHYFNLVPKTDGFNDEEELICKKIVDKDGNIIAGVLNDLPKGHSYYVVDKDL